MNRILTLELLNSLGKVHYSRLFSTGVPQRNDKEIATAFVVTTTIEVPVIGELGAGRTAGNTVLQVRPSHLTVRFNILPGHSIGDALIAKVIHKAIKQGSCVVATNGSRQAFAGMSASGIDQLLRACASANGMDQSNRMSQRARMIDTLTL